MSISSSGPDKAPNSRSAEQIHVLRRLLEAFNSAQQYKEDAWLFAVQLGEFQAEHISATVLRALVVEGLVRHGEDRTTRRSGPRVVVPLSHLKVSEDSCFILTESGVAIAREVIVQGKAVLQGGLEPTSVEGPKSILPSFVICQEDGHRELRVGDHVVKRFRRAAPNQEMILARFEKENWQHRIQSPFGLTPGKNPKRRVHYSVDRLNRGQIERLLRFHGDGSGHAICWEFLE
jgi:hypothetical protein